MNTSQALIRNQYRCVVTKRYDHRSVKLNRELQKTVMSDPSTWTEHTHCAHISTYSNIELGSEKGCPLFNFFASCLTNIDYLCIVRLCYHDVDCHAAIWV